MSAEEIKNLVPGEDDENVGGDAPKKKKSKEERDADRKVIFWFLVFMILIGIAFYLYSHLGSNFLGDLKINSKGDSGAGVKLNAPKWKGYTEVNF